MPAITEDRIDASRPKWHMPPPDRWWRRIIRRVLPRRAR